VDAGVKISGPRPAAVHAAPRRRGATAPALQPDYLLDLQRTAGNAAVDQLLRAVQRQAPPAAPAAAPPQTVGQTEWTSAPALHARYPTWQAYDAVRHVVASWTHPAVADPLSYITSALAEWNANPHMHSAFDNNFGGDPHRSYLNLKRLYQARGIADPANYLATNIVGITFYNRHTEGHADLKTALTAAETALTTAGHTFTLDKGTWSYVPRTFNNSINSLSNHALGKAIDINPSSNPHLTSASDFRVVNAVCGTVLTAGLLATADYDTLASASDLFKQNFNDAWVTQQEQTLATMQAQHPHPPGFARQKALVKAIHSRRNALNGYAAHGFLNLPKALVEGLQNAGLGWGGAWKSAKDFMHFELANP